MQRINSLDNSTAPTRTCAFDRNNCSSPIPFRSSGRALSARGPRSDFEELLVQRPARPLHPPQAHKVSSFPDTVDAFQQLREEQKRIELERAQAFKLACTRRS